MAIGLGRALGYALKGTLEGVAAATTKEDKFRQDLTKTTYASAMERFQELEDARIKQDADIKDEIDTVKMLMSNNFGGKVLTEAEATAAYQFSKKMGLSLDKVFEQYDFSGTDTAKVSRGADTKKSIVPKKRVDVASLGSEFAEDSLIATGRWDQVDDDTRRWLKSSGITDSVSMRGESIVEGVKITPKSGDNPYKGFKYGAYEFTDASGDTKVVQGILNSELDPNKGRLFLNLETNKYEPVPANAVWRGETARKQINIEDDPRQFEMNATTTAMFLKSDKDLPKLSAQYRDQVAAGVTLIDGLDRMSKYALKEQNYSGLVSVLGSISRGVKNEIAGFSFAFSNDNVSEADALAADSLNIRNPDGSVNNSRALAVIDSLDTRMNSIEAITDKAERVSRERELMETMALRLAIAEIVADGDARPSDFDVQSRLRNYLSNSGEAFIEKAKETIAKTRATLDAKRNVVAQSPAIRSATGSLEIKDLTDLERNATQHFLDMYAPTLDSTLPTPSFLQDGFDSSQVSTETVDPDQPIVETVTNSAGQEVKRVIMPDGSYLKQGGTVLEIPATVDDSSILGVAMKQLKGTK